MPFTVYKASAGSGKTFSLVREYLKIVLQEPGDFRHVLAITFTNKVANEMKDRILKALSALAYGNADPDDMMVSLLSKDTGLSPEALSVKASMAFELILHHYSEFSIGTIDSFSHRILRAFAHDFGLPVNFQVEMDTENMLETIVDILLDRVGDDRDLTGILVDFVETRIGDETDWRIERELIRFAHNLLDENAQDHLSKVRNISLRDFRQIATSVHAQAKKAEDRIQHPAKEALALIRSMDIPPEAFYGGNGGLPSFFSGIIRGKYDEPNERTRTTLEEDKWTSGKCTGEQAAAIRSIRDRLVVLSDKIVEELQAGLPRLRLMNLLRRSIYPMAVLNEIARTLDEFKKQNNLVHISEFNTRICRIIMGEPVPFIYERLGEKYHHILIDEFQDTSAMQWMSFVPLIENSLASGYFNLVVGDGKQAIYRFRNGDVEQFSSLPALPGSESDPLLRQREQSLARHFVEVSLNSNFRSRPGIIEFNNRFFRILSDRLFHDGNEVYRDLEQKPVPGKEGGYIRIEMPDGDEGVAAYRSETVTRVLGIINAVVNDGYRKQDIAVLCRSNHNAGEVARFLLLNGIDVISSESLLAGNSPHVSFLVSFLRFLHGLPDPLVHAALATYLQQQGYTASGLHDLLKKIRDEKAQGAGILEIFRDCGLDIRAGELAALPVYDLTEKLIRIFHLNEPADPHIQFFLDAVLRFTSRFSTASNEFLSWWEKNESRVSIVAPEGLDAVRVMTIHKAKGLQFPVVIYAFATEIRSNTKEFLWTDLAPDEVPGLPAALVSTEKTLSETAYAALYETEKRKSLLDLVNLLYVVMTRPEDRLYILTKAASIKDEIQSVPAFFAFVLKEMGVYDEGQTCYEFGTGSRHEEVALKDAVQPQRLDKMISEEWRQRIRVRLHAPEMWDLDEADESSRWGNRIHTILSRIMTKDDLPAALDDAVRSGLILDEDRKGIAEILFPVFLHPLLTGLFSDDVKVKTEPEILDEGGLFYRPDRVVFIGDEVYIVDYKTGRQNERHRTQLNQYATLLGKMGYENIRKMLVYLEPKLNVVRF